LFFKINSDSFSASLKSWNLRMALARISPMPSMFCNLELEALKIADADPKWSTSILACTGPSWGTMVKASWNFNSSIIENCR
jgi:hypothetical protein